MTTSRIPAVIDALVSTLTAALAGTQVFDGKWISVPDGNYITVGWTPNGDMTTGQQTWAGLGNKARNEQIDVPCYCDSFSGSTTVSDRRNAAFAIFAAAETAIRNDPLLGGAIPNPGKAQIGTYNDHTEQTEAGLEVGVVFHVLVDTRI